MKVEQLTLFDMPAQSGRKACLSIGDFSKVLASKGIETGKTRLFAKLREWKLIDKCNVPYQKYIDSGYFKVIKEPYAKRGMETLYVYLKILVTPNGQKYIEERFRNEGNGDRS